MGSITVTEDIKGDADAVFAALSDFAGVQVGGPVTSFETEGEGIGMIRTIGMGERTVVEKLEQLDAKRRVFGYSIIVTPDCALPVSEYEATIEVTDKGNGTAHVNWTGTFEPAAGVPEEKVHKLLNGTYAGGIARAKKAVGG